MDICGEALIGFVCAHGDSFEFFELAEEILDQVTPLVDSLSFGSNPTATTALKRMAADQTEYWGVNPGDKIACIANT